MTAPASTLASIRTILTPGQLYEVRNQLAKLEARIPTCTTFEEWESLEAQMKRLETAILRYTASCEAAMSTGAQARAA